MRNNTNSIKKNYAYHVAYEAVVFLTPLLLSPYIARVLGAEGIGIFSYSFTVAHYFVLVMMLGINIYGNREVAMKRGDDVTLQNSFSEILALHLIVSVFVLCLYLIYSLFICRNPLFAWIQILYVISGLLDITWLYAGLEEFRLISIRNIVIRLLMALMTFVFVKGKEDVWIYCLIMAGSNLAGQVSLWLPLRRYVSLIRVRSWELIKHVKPLLILFVPILAVSIYKEMDKIMIGLISGSRELGFYENADKVVGIPMSLITAFGTVMLPRMSKLAAKGKKEQALRYLSVSSRYVMCMAFALFFGLAAIGNTFSEVFWGSEFAKSGWIIMILSCTIPFMAFANILRTQYLIPNKLDKDYLFSVLLGAITNLLINLLLIPRYGVFGAAAGTVVAEVAVCLSQAYSVRKELPLLEYIRSFVFFVVPGTIMFVAVYLIGKYMGSRVLTLFLQIGIGMFVYIAAAVHYLYKKNDPVFFASAQAIRNRIRRNGP